MGLPPLLMSQKDIYSAATFCKGGETQEERLDKILNARARPGCLEVVGFEGDLFAQFFLVARGRIHVDSLFKGYEKTHTWGWSEATTY